MTNTNDMLDEIIELMEDVGGRLKALSESEHGVLLNRLTSALIRLKSDEWQSQQAQGEVVAYYDPRPGVDWEYRFLEPDVIEQEDNRKFYTVPLIANQPAPAAVPDEAFNLIEAIRAELTWSGWRKTSSRDWVMDSLSELLSMLTASPAPEPHDGWVIADNPPTANGEYLVHYSGAVFAAEYKFSANRWVFGSGMGAEELTGITHWMPKPPPPLQEEAER